MINNNRGNNSGEAREERLKQFAVAFHSSTATEIHLTNGIIWANKSLSSQVAEAVIPIQSINGNGWNTTNKQRC